MTTVWILMTLLVPIGPAATPSGSTQLELNEQAGRERAAAETEVAVLLSRLRERAAGDPAALARLEAAQVAWRSYRDAQIELGFHFADGSAGSRTGGSVRPMCVALELARLARQRARELRALLEPEEGDVCAPAWR